VPEFEWLRLTTEFLSDLTHLSNADQRRVLRALEQLDADEATPSLCIHPLHGDMEGLWSASASRSLRITFERLDRAQKHILGCSHHYGD
jgi:mRNA-degrading endonuclease YafQ of YafQ-DinJ toxin-antitoxin module